jgi:hypothetical protein
LARASATKKGFIILTPNADVIKLFLEANGKESTINRAIGGSTVITGTTSVKNIGKYAVSSANYALKSFIILDTGLIFSSKARAYPSSHLALPANV